MEQQRYQSKNLFECITCLFDKQIIVIAMHRSFIIHQIDTHHQLEGKAINRRLGMALGNDPMRQFHWVNNNYYEYVFVISDLNKVETLIVFNSIT